MAQQLVEELEASGGSSSNLLLSGWLLFLNVSMSCLRPD
jgi:hypothetical protein